jgi:hypothetical protein
MQTIKFIVYGLVGFILALLMGFYLIFKGIMFLGNLFFAIFFGLRA